MTRGRNPAWNRDELILAFDVYCHNFPRLPASDTTPAVVNLSNILRELKRLLDGYVPENYRSPSAVNLKFSNFRYINPHHKGKGLQSVGQGDIQIFNEFWQNQDELHRLAMQILKGIEIRVPLMPYDDFEDISNRPKEGRLLTRVHRLRERDEKLIKMKKKIALGKSGRLMCECCEFDFATKYGEHGEDIIEFHLNKSILDTKLDRKTKPEDLALVCSNCHKVIHRSKPWLTVEQVRNFLPTN